MTPKAHPMSDLSHLPPPSLTTEAVDLAVLPELTGCDDAVRDEFLRDFLPVLRSEVQAMADALSPPDCAAVEAVAHRLKSAARYVGAIGLGDLSERVELVSQGGDVVACQALHGPWLAECQRVEHFLRGLPGVG